MSMRSAICGIINLSNFAMARFSSTGSITIELAPMVESGKSTVLPGTVSKSIVASLECSIVIMSFGAEVKLLKNCFEIGQNKQTRLSVDVLYEYSMGR